MNARFCGLTFFLTLLFLSTSLVAKNSSGGFLDFNIYPYLSDADNDTSVTINAGARLANRFSYFGFINMGNQAGSSELSETNTFYSEQNVRWQIQPDSPFDLTLQMNFRTGDDNDRHRLGVRWRLNDSIFIKDFFKRNRFQYAVNLHLIQFDNEPGNVWQIEHSFRKTWGTSDRTIYLSGFIDHTFNQTLPSEFPDNPIVAEAQFGIELMNNFFLVTEYRRNEYRIEQSNNWAIGAEYVITW